VEQTALVSGSPARVQEVADALEKLGFAVRRAAPGPEGLAAACEELAPGSLGCYVQLPRETEVEGATLVERVRQFLAQGLLARFDATATVLPFLGAEACVVLVAGNVPGAATPDDRHARIDLLRVLARAILAECGDGDVRAVVVGYDRSPEEIADIAVHRGDEHGRRVAQVAALPQDLTYEDWQREVLSLTTNEE
jgi:CheY-like chemotaxis protein